MRKLLPALFLSLLLSSSFNLMAQNWVNGGNALTANGSLGTTGSIPFIFKTNNKEQGRITNSGLWGIGTSSPDSRVTINCTPDQVPFRVQVNGSTKLFVHSGGGVSIGTSTPPANGLFVAGNVGIGTSAPENKLHVSKGSAGFITANANAPLVVENSTNSYINILAPDANETGILFGRPGGAGTNVDGGIIYNNVGTPGGFQFRTNGNVNRMVINGRGNLGVGIDPGFYKMEILCGDLFGVAGLGIANTSGDEWGITPDATGLNLSYLGDFKGNFNPTNGNYTSVSDRRLKTNIRPMSPMLEKIMQLKPSSYQFKDATDKQEYNGFIAQDVMELFPGMVTHHLNPARKQDVYLMDYSGFGVLATKGIQELQPLIEEQKQKIAALEGAYKLKITMLEDQLAKLEAVFATITASKNGNTSDRITNASSGHGQPNSFDKNIASLPYSARQQNANKTHAARDAKL